jgi:hypothetical protein
MSLEDYKLHSCNDHSHSHLSKAQVYELQSHGVIEWLYGSITSTAKDKGVFRIRRFFAARGLSCSVGSELAEMLRIPETKAIASVMYSHIKMRKEEQENQCSTPY